MVTNKRKQLNEDLFYRSIIEEMKLIDAPDRSIICFGLDKEIVLKDGIFL